MSLGRVSWPSERGKLEQLREVEWKEVLRGLIVRLNGGQFINHLLATVELPDLC
jgi:hypothetical protein